MKVVFVLALATAIAVAQDAEQPKPLATTEYGKVEGTTSLSRSGRMFYKFTGIPYAKAERFQTPQKLDKWEGVKDATKFGSACAQHNFFLKTDMGKDDCLFLNVFTPKMNKEGDHKVLLPVMVYIHPGFGAYKFGDSSTFSPKYFMDQDVVIVTFNYRLGLLGFLNTGDEQAQGNMGLKDQVEALKWVKENIENFGGDKARVTLFGTSAGAASALYHTLSPMSKGLFQNVIAESGTPLSPWAFVADPIANAKKAGERLGCPIDTSENLVKCLKEKDVLQLVEKKTEISSDPKTWDPEVFAKIPHFAPSIETLLKDQKEGDVFLTEAPFKLFTEGKVASKVPVILTVNDHDGHIYPAIKLMNDTESLEKLNKDWNKLAPFPFIYDKTATDKDATSKKIRDFYFGDKDIAVDTRKELTKLYFDRYFFIPIRYSGKVYSKVAPTYLAVFARKPEYGMMDFAKADFEDRGVSHLDEIEYFFKCEHTDDSERAKAMCPPEITKEHPAYMFSDQIVKLWTSFAETGKPTKVWGDAKEWKKAEYPEKPKWMKLKDELKFIDENKELSEAEKPYIEDLTKRSEFWNKIYFDDLIAEVTPPKPEKF